MSDIDDQVDYVFGYYAANPSLPLVDLFDEAPAMFAAAEPAGTRGGAAALLFVPSAVVLGSVFLANRYPVAAGVLGGVGFVSLLSGIAFNSSRWRVRV
jgi:hypothetical protein